MIAKVIGYFSWKHKRQEVGLKQLAQLWWFWLSNALIQARKAVLTTTSVLSEDTRGWWKTFFRHTFASRKLIHRMVWLSYTCGQWYWWRCGASTGTCSWSWGMTATRADKERWKRQFSSCFLVFLGSFGSSVSWGSFFGSPLGKCWLQTWWWSLARTSFRSSASIQRCLLASSLGKRCIPTHLSFARVFLQTRQVSPGILSGTNILTGTSSHLCSFTVVKTTHAITISLSHKRTKRYGMSTRKVQTCQS